MRRSSNFWMILGFLFLLPLAAQAQELTLFTMCPPRSINWASPRSMAFGAMTNNLTFYHMNHKHAIGHVFIELKNGEERIMAGSTPDSSGSSDSDLIFKDKIGLGILFYPFKGRIETVKDLDQQVQERYKTGRIAFIRFMLSPEMYQRLKSYWAEYNERGYGSIYNGDNQPRKGLGAGCSAYGVSYLEVAGLLHPVWQDKWKLTVRVPEALIGDPKTGKKVPITKLAMWGRWASETEPNRLLELYDPDLIYKWINVANKKECESPSGKVTPLKRGKALGLQYDCTHVPVPAEPLFLVDHP